MTIALPGHRAANAPVWRTTAAMPAATLAAYSAASLPAAG